MTTPVLYDLCWVLDKNHSIFNITNFGVFIIPLSPPAILHPKLSCTLCLRFSKSAEGSYSLLCQTSLLVSYYFHQTPNLLLIMIHVNKWTSRDVAHMGMLLAELTNEGWSKWSKKEFYALFSAKPTKSLIIVVEFTHTHTNIHPPRPIIPTSDLLTGIGARKTSLCDLLPGFKLKKSIFESAKFIGRYGCWQCAQILPFLSLTSENQLIYISQLHDSRITASSWKFVKFKRIWEVSW